MDVIAVVSRHTSDLQACLESVPGVRVHRIDPDDLAHYDLSAFYAIAVLGGTDSEGLLLHAPQRAKLEAEIRAGKRVFAEYIASVGDIYFLGPESTRFKRLVAVSDRLIPYGIKPGDILDDQCGQVLPTWMVNPDAEIMLCYNQCACAHNRMDPLEALGDRLASRALWLEQPNLMVCNFRMCNFRKARFAPLDLWPGMARFVMEWLLSKPVRLTLDPPYTTRPILPEEDLYDRVREAAGKAVAWFERADMLIAAGTGGAKEGLGTEIQADGRQKVVEGVRTDCSAETAMAYFFDALLTGDQASRQISDHLSDFCFGHMVERGGLFHGMMRWSENAWTTVYADDVARVCIPQLFKFIYAGDDRYKNEVTAAMEFLIRTTGTDGTRVMRTDTVQMDEQKIQALSEKPHEFPCAHYNAFYMGALALAAKAYGRPDFLRMAEKGLSTLMDAYPDTKREISQTEEYCRLILPLSCLYWATGKDQHRAWLYRVAQDLQAFRHPTGAYLEWDDGHKANLAHNVDGECSMLVENGDSVVDLLYSLNWLPIGFMQAYLVTEDLWFLELWESIAGFMVSVQIHSQQNAMIDGAWCRGYDVDLMEVYGTPNDVGWGPWAVESGWTVGEIASGLMMGLVKDELKERLKQM